MYLSDDNEFRTSCSFFFYFFFSFLFNSKCFSYISMYLDLLYNIEKISACPETPTLPDLDFLQRECGFELAVFLSSIIAYLVLIQYTDAQK